MEPENGNVKEKEREARRTFSDTAKVVKDDAAADGKDIEPYQNVLAGQYRTHQCIRHSLASLKKPAAEILSGLKEKKKFESIHVKGFLDYFQTIIQFLDNHHETEDNIWFPFTQKRIPGSEKVFTELAQDHHDLEELLAKGRNLIKQLFEKPETIDLWEQIGPYVESLEGMVNPHLQKEDDYFSVELLQKHLSKEDCAEVKAAIMKKVRQEDGSKIFPLMLYSLNNEEQTQFLKEMPGPVGWILRNVFLGWWWKSKYQDHLPFYYNPPGKSSL